jgi:hypothetical protein
MPPGSLERPRAVAGPVRAGSCARLILEMYDKPHAAQVVVVVNVAVVAITVQPRRGETGLMTGAPLQCGGKGGRLGVHRCRQARAAAACQCAVLTRCSILHCCGGGGGGGGGGRGGTGGMPTINARDDERGLSRVDGSTVPTHPRSMAESTRSGVESLAEGVPGATCLAVQRTIDVVSKATKLPPPLTRLTARRCS